MVADFAEQLHGIAVGKRMLITDSGVQSGGEKEAGIDGEFSLCGCAERYDGTYQCYKNLLHGLLVYMGLICERKFLEDVRVKAAGIENILILDGQRDDATAYLVLRDFKTKHLLVGNVSLGMTSTLR